MSRRLDRVNELLRREIGNVVQKDYEWHGKLVTISEVDVTQDLKEAKVWTSVLGGDAQPVIDKLNRDMATVLRSAEVHDRFVSMGILPVVETPEQLAGRIKRESEKWKRVIEVSGAKID